MSKAVTNEEVEDVLSSIRRLVSEDKRPLAGLRSAPIGAAAGRVSDVDRSGETFSEDGNVADETPETPEQPVDRLVLTSALRVAEEPSQADLQMEPQTDAPLDLRAVARETWSADEAGSEGEAFRQDKDAPLMLFPEEQAAEDDAAVQGQDPAMDALDALVHQTLESEGEGDYSDESYWNDEPPEESPADFDIEAQARMRSEEEARFSDEGMKEHTGSDAQDASDVTVDENKPAALLKETDNIAVLPLTAKIAALEAAVGGIEQEWEPDGNEEEDFTPADAAAMAWEDDIDLDALGAPVVEPVEEIEQAQPQAEPDNGGIAAALGSEDQVLDEDALRELVSEIVREELQGALGERITRNVRKLVRREIHRALTAQELE